MTIISLLTIMKEQKQLRYTWMEVAAGWRTLLYFKKKDAEEDSTPATNIPESRRRWKAGISRAERKITSELRAERDRGILVGLAGFSAVTGNAYDCMQ